MMLRDKETGMVFDTPGLAVSWFCHRRSGCEGCPMDSVSVDRLCKRAAMDRPFEVARAMGMECVRYRLTDEERRRMEVFGALWVSRTVEDEDAAVQDAAEMWTEEPHLVFGSVFVTGQIWADPARGRVARCLSVFFPSLAPGECIGADEVVVLEEGDDGDG